LTKPCGGNARLPVCAEDRQWRGRILMHALGRGDSTGALANAEAAAQADLAGDAGAVEA